MTVSVKNLRGRSRDHENQKETTHGLVWWTRVASAPSRRERTPQHRPFGFYVKVFFGRAVLVEVVGDGVGLVVRVGDAADVAEARRPARAVAVPIQMLRLLENDDIIFIWWNVTSDVVEVEDAT